MIAYIRDDVSLVIFPQFSFAKILSMRVAKLLYTLDGLSIVGMKEQLCEVSKNSLVKLHVSALRRFILYSPMRTKLLKDTAKFV